MTFPSKYAGKCKSCGKVISIGMDIDKNDSGIYCPDGKNCQGSQTVSGTLTTAKPRVEVPIEQIVAEIQAIKGEMKEMSGEAQEGIWKYAISRKMSR